jgi:hypothetical protein
LAIADGASYTAAAHQVGRRHNETISARHAPDGLPQVSTFTIWRTLHASGLSWPKSRTWCETGVAMRRRKHGVVRVSDPDALAKKS